MKKPPSWVARRWCSPDWFDQFGKRPPDTLRLWGFGIVILCLTAPDGRSVGSPLVTRGSVIGLLFFSPTVQKVPPFRYGSERCPRYTACAAHARRIPPAVDGAAGWQDQLRQQLGSQVPNGARLLEAQKPQGRFLSACCLNPSSVVLIDLGIKKRTKCRVRVYLEVHENAMKSRSPSGCGFFILTYLILISTNFSTRRMSAKSFARSAL